MTEFVIGSDGTLYREQNSRTGLVSWTADSADVTGELTLTDGDVFLVRYKQADNLELPVSIYTYISASTTATGFYMGLYGAETNDTNPNGIATLTATSANETALIGPSTILVPVGTSGTIVRDTLSFVNPISRPNATYHYFAWLAHGLAGTLKIAAQVGLAADLVNWLSTDHVYRAAVLPGPLTSLPASIDMDDCTAIAERGWAAISV